MRIGQLGKHQTAAPAEADLTDPGTTANNGLIVQ